MSFLLLTEGDTAMRSIGDAEETDDAAPGEKESLPTEDLLSTSCSPVISNLQTLRTNE